MRFRLRSRPSPPEFRFLEPGPLVDAELELVPPSYNLLEAMMASCLHPLTMRDEPDAAMTSKADLMRQLDLWPGGRQPADPMLGTVASYHFWMQVQTGRDTPAVAGSVALRIAEGPEIEMYYGHTGYHVYPPYRGHRYAERAVRLLLPLARAHGLAVLWITANPDNYASRRTCERLGATFVDVVPVPRKHVLYKRGDHHKCRYRIELA